MLAAYTTVEMNPRAKQTKKMARHPVSETVSRKPTVLQRYRDWFFGAALIAVTLLAYQPAWSGKPVLDDMDHLITTKELRSLDGLVSLWIRPHTTRQFHPLLDTIYWIEANLWGQAPIGYHLLSILLHVAGALLLVKILQKLQVPGAWLAAAIFALHPVQVESVAWMVELKNTLSGVFFFGCVLAYLRFDHQRTWQSYALVVFLFLCGVLSKAIVATFPAVILILLWWKRGKLDWARDVKPLLPFVALGIAAGLLTAWMERAFSGAEGEEFEFSMLDRFLIAGRAFWFYAAKLCWPSNLTLFYPRWRISSATWWQYLFPVAAISLLLLAWAIRKQRRWPLAALLFFGGLLFPLLGFFNVNFFRFSFVADHFQYLPSLGIIVPVAAGVTMMFGQLRQWQPVGAIFCAALLAALAGLTWMQSHMYRDFETCYRTVIARNPKSWEAHINVGVELLRQVRLDEASFHFQKALELEPAYALAAGRAYVGLGETCFRKGQLDEAINYLQTALRIDPRSAPAHNVLGTALHRKGQLSEAITEYRQSLRLCPQSVVIKNSLAWMLATCADASLRDGPQALELAKQADQLCGGANPKVLRSLAAAYAENRLFSNASETARRALGLAVPEGQSPFTLALRNEIALYDAGLPYHETLH
jgi:tetratricopeptide (TPR) repeat protein